MFSDIEMCPSLLPPTVMVVDITVNIILGMSEAHETLWAASGTQAITQVPRGRDWEEREAEALARAANFFTAFCSEGNGGASILSLSWAKFEAVYI